MADAWTDVIRHPNGGFVCAVSEPGAVRVEHDGVLLWRTHLPAEADYLRFIDIAISPDAVVRVVGIAQGGAVYQVAKYSAWYEGQADFQMGCAVVWEDAEEDFVVYLQVAPTIYTRNDVPHAMPESSQGFQDVFSDGRIVFGSDTVGAWFFDTANAGRQRFNYRTERGDYIAGDADNGRIGLFRKSDRMFWVVRQGVVNYGIHLDVDSDRVAVVALIDGGFPFYGVYPPFPEQPEPNPEPEPEPIPEPEPMPDIPAELRDQLTFVAEVRKSLFPDKYQPGHPDANPDGFLPLRDAEKAALWAKHLAWRLKQKYPHLPIGLARAKQGSDNHGGATAAVPEGFTTDVIAIENGAHWDFQVDGHNGAAYPRWALESNPSNYPAIAARFVAAFDPGGTQQPQIHLYEGGENDTGICDVCGQPRSSEIHVFKLPPITPPQPVCNCAAELALVKQSVLLLEQERDGMAFKVAALENAVKNLREKPAPGVSLPDKVRLKGSTTSSGSSFLRHAHGVDGEFEIQAVPE